VSGSPDGEEDAETVTVLWNPLRLVRVAVMLPEDPGMIVWD